MGLAVTWLPFPIPTCNPSWSTKVPYLLDTAIDPGLDMLSKKNLSETFFCNFYRCPSAILGTETYLHVGGKIYEVNREKSEIKK